MPRQSCTIQCTFARLNSGDGEAAETYSLYLNDLSSPFLNDPTAVHFADDLNVDHIAVKNDVAALSLGTKGIALYDVSDPDNPIERGIFPVGYAYKSEFWGESLVVCTREGLKIINIER